ncbi:MAG: hypothetical protein WD381_03325 [Balneolaceae bacterium]
MRPEFTGILIRILLAVMIIEWVVLLIEQSWLSLFLDTTMQKPMLGDPSDLTDTMWDMIVNAVGAIIISGTDWWYLKKIKASL